MFCVPVLSQMTAADTTKLQSLEEELAKLRAQVAAIVLERECSEGNISGVESGTGCCRYVFLSRN